MEKDCRWKKKKEGSERSPLQELNGIRINEAKTKRRGKNACPVVISTVSDQLPNGSSRSLISSSNCSSSSSWGTVAVKKLRSDNKPAHRSGLRRASPSKMQHRLTGKLCEKKPPSIHKRKCGENNSKTALKNGGRSNPLSLQGKRVSKMKKGFKYFEEKKKNSPENCSGKPLAADLNRTSMEKVKWCDEYISNYGVCKHSIEIPSKENVASNVDTAAGTPPVEASVSPEIHCRTHSKMLVSNESATPVCYGAGHLVSGVADKRKCRSRGILIGGCGRTNMFNDKMSDDNVINDSLASSILLPDDASVHWLLSPCDKVCEDEPIDRGERSDQNQVLSDNDLSILDSLFSPTLMYDNESNLASGSSGCTFSDFARVGISKNSIRITSLSPSKSPDLPGSGRPPSSDNVPPLAATLDSEVCEASVKSLETENCMHGLDWERPTVQTPITMHHRNSSHFEIYSKTISIGKEGQSPKGNMSIFNAPGIDLYAPGIVSPYRAFDLNHIQKNVDSTCSWISDNVLDDMALTQMRISWRDGLVSSIVVADEDDCCRCLSDEVDVSYQGASEMAASHRSDDARYESNDENHIGFSGDLSYKVVDHGPTVTIIKGDETFQDVQNKCAESICINRGDVGDSSDSDWTNCLENGE